MGVGTMGVGKTGIPPSEYLVIGKWKANRDLLHMYYQKC